MALTNEQLISLGFKPSVRGRGGLSKNRKYDSLVLSLNETDFLYTGYNPYKKQINYKTIWKSFKDSEGNRITYEVISLGDTGYFELKNYINNTIATQEANKQFLASNYQELLHSSAAVDWNNKMAVEEGSTGINISHELPASPEEIKQAYLNPSINDGIEVTNKIPLISGENN